MKTSHFLLVAALSLGLSNIALAQTTVPGTVGTPATPGSISTSTVPGSALPGQPGTTVGTVPGSAAPIGVAPGTMVTPGTTTGRSINDNTGLPTGQPVTPTTRSQRGTTRRATTTTVRP